MHRLLSTAVTAILVLVASPALADHEGNTTNDEQAQATILLSSTSTTTTAVVGGIILTVVMATDADSMENYLDDNAVALQRDLHLGAGETVDDLALAFGIADEERAAFGRLVRDERDELLDLADPARLNRERAKRFIDVIVAASLRRGLIEPVAG